MATTVPIYFADADAPADADDITSFWAAWRTLRRDLDALLGLPVDHPRRLSAKDKTDRALHELITALEATPRLDHQRRRPRPRR